MRSATHSRTKINNLLGYQLMKMPATSTNLYKSGHHKKVFPCNPQPLAVEFSAIPYREPKMKNSLQSTGIIVVLWWKKGRHHENHVDRSFCFGFNRRNRNEESSSENYYSSGVTDGNARCSNPTADLPADLPRKVVSLGSSGLPSSCPTYEGGGLP